MIDGRMVALCRTESENLARRVIAAHGAVSRLRSPCRRCTGRPVPRHVGEVAIPRPTEDAAPPILTGAPSHT